MIKLLSYLSQFEMHSTETGRQIRLCHTLCFVQFFNTTLAIFIIHNKNGTLWNRNGLVISVYYMFLVNGLITPLLYYFDMLGTRLFPASEPYPSLTHPILSNLLSFLVGCQTQKLYPLAGRAPSQKLDSLGWI